VSQFTNDVREYSKGATKLARLEKSRKAIADLEKSQAGIIEKYKGSDDVLKLFTDEVAAVSKKAKGDNRLVGNSKKTKKPAAPAETL
jgi:hypothetical protein